MIVQAELQEALYKELLEYHPKCLKVMNYAQQIDGLKQRLSKQADQMLANIPESYIEPYLERANYELVLNNSLTLHKKYSKYYQLKLMQYRKSFHDNCLNKENLYDKKNAFITTLTDKQRFSDVILCNKSFVKMYGGSYKSLLGSKFSSLGVTDILGSIGDDQNRPIENDNLLMTTATSPVQSFGIHSSGYVFQTDVLIHRSPFIATMNYQSGIVRASLEQRDCIIVRENGEIIGPTKRLGTKLGILRNTKETHGKPFHIRQLSEDLEYVNRAFNYIKRLSKTRGSNYNNSPEINRKSFNDNASSCRIFIGKSDVSNKDSFMISEEEAREIYAVYTSTGQDITLRSLLPSEGSDSPKSYSYTCKVVNLFNGETYLKVFQFEGATEGKKDEKLKAQEFSEDIILKTLDKDSEPSVMTDDSANFGEVEERDQNLTDFEPIMLKTNDILISPIVRPTPEFQRMLITEGDSAQFFSPTLNTQPNQMLSSTQRFLTTQRNNMNVVKEALFIRPEKVKRLLSKETGETFTIESSHDVAGIVRSVAQRSSRTDASRKSSRGSEATVSDTVQKILKAKFYPKSLSFFAFLFYFMIVLCFSCLLMFKISLNQSIESFSLTKDILNKAQNNNYILLSVQRLLKTLYNFDTGSWTPADL
ncbi:Hypothetical predicted protein, partial [Olea europaea subsp. europaea]